MEPSRSAAIGRSNPSSLRDCDLILKGGVASGVVYPKLIATLSTRYRFRSIGGTSVGAIAAAACAAAEYGRNNGQPKSFDRLAELPEELGWQTKGRSRLFWLFQPGPALARHFEVLAGALNLGGARAAGAIVGGVLRMYRWAEPLAAIAGIAIVTSLLWIGATAALPSAPRIPVELALAVVTPLVVALAIGRLARRLDDGRAVRQALTLVVVAVVVIPLLAGLVSGVPWQLRWSAIALIATATALVLTAVTLLAVTFRFLSTMLRGLHANGYGFCTGRTTVTGQGERPEALIDWLVAYLNELAGLDPAGPPLTFGQLWGEHERRDRRTINVEFMTTAVSQQMVYTVPFRPGTAQFYYDPHEWKELFPKVVMAALSEARAADPDEAAAVTVIGPGGRPLRRFPGHGRSLPVAVAVRLSLSFPLLLSAVPLYAIDRTLKCNQGDRPGPLTATRIWFSDGGIGSNMPLHMFDSLLPRRPTFAAYLKKPHPDFPVKPRDPTNVGGRIFLPEGKDGRDPHWPAPPDEAGPRRGLIAFARSIVATMQNWRDEILLPYPGYRDRIVRISLLDSEGGLNLDMEPEPIKAMSEAGQMAADRLIDRFHPAGAQRAEGWDQHRCTRLRTLLGTIQPAARTTREALSLASWDACLEHYGADERDCARTLIEGLAALGGIEACADIELDRKADKPLAQVRIVPRM